MTGTVYQASDLAGTKRTQFIADAKDGMARLRAPDGQSLVMVPEDDLTLLRRLNDYLRLHLQLDVLAVGAGTPSIHTLGEHAWLRNFELADLREFAAELGEALVAAQADRDSAVVDRLVEEWRITARQLEDPLRRSVLLGAVDPASDLRPAERPTEGSASDATEEANA